MKLSTSARHAAIHSIPPLSAGASQLITLMTDADHTISDVTRLVESDATIAAQMLREVNSSAYALNRRIDSIADALVYLGDKRVLAIALQACASGVYDTALQGYDSQKGELWAHSLCAAIGARAIATQARMPINPGAAYTAGLLHDIGKAVIGVLAAITHSTMESELNLGAHGSFLETERKVQGATHCEVGAELAELWRLPDSITCVIQHHHHPAEAPPEYKALVYIVHLGDFIAMMAGFGTGTDSFQYHLDEKYQDYIRLTKKQFEFLVSHVQMEFLKIHSTLPQTGEAAQS